MEMSFTIEIMIDEIIPQAEEDDEILTLQEISNVQEENWTTVPQRSKDKAQNYAKNGRDAMGRFIVEDGSYRMIPRLKMNAKENRQ
jgi:hypothetical protein